MTAGLGQIRFPTTNNTGDDRLIRLQTFFVKSARFGINNGCLRSVVVVETMNEFLRTKMNVNILTAGNGSRRAPTCRCKIDSDGRCEISRIGEQRNRALDKRFFRSVTAQSSTQANMVPGIRKTEAIATKQVNAFGLTDGAHDP
jgi:hypothetical protein